MKHGLFSLLVLIFSTNVFADCVGNSCTDVKITRMIVTANGDTVIGTSGDESKLSCDAGSKGYIRLNQALKNYNATYSLLLTSHTTEHPIWVRTNDSGACELIYLVSDK